MARARSTNLTTLSLTLNCDDNGSVKLTLTVDDGNGHTPSVNRRRDQRRPPRPLRASRPDVNEGDSFELSLSSPTDPGSNDTHTYQFDCGDGGGYSAASATASRSCPTTDNGSRSVSLKILDDDGGFAEYPGTVTVVNVDPAVAAPAFQVASIGCRTSVTSAGSASTTRARMPTGRWRSTGTTARRPATTPRAGEYRRCRRTSTTPRDVHGDGDRDGQGRRRRIEHVVQQRRRESDVHGSTSSRRSTTPRRAVSSSTR